MIICKNDNLLYLLICFTVDVCLEGASVSIVTSLMENVDNTIVVCNFIIFIILIFTYGLFLSTALFLTITEAGFSDDVHHNPRYFHSIHACVCISDSYFGVCSNTLAAAPAVTISIAFISRE